MRSPFSEEPTASRNGPKKAEAYFAEYAMIETSSKPSSSRACRIAAICPSIMPDGLTTCAPARAWETAIRQ